ncbi:hypothetical protein DSM112329_04397 [Paraconexibacter sp. AEG42_29]|uniref:Uncharacterized protein n=1 Tax=Paraconexibacter sp. AEG42_29 TaxID=2997339 RepID=A0AAU7B0S2_9ACTN
MTPDDEYDRYLDDFGGRLRSAATGPPPRARRRWVLGVGGTLTLAGAATAIVLAIGGGAAGERLDVVAEARAALAPRGKILHLVAYGRLGPPGVRTIEGGTRNERWIAVDRPRRWRERSAGVRDPGNVFERSYARGVLRTYTAADARLEVRSGYSEAGATARPPALVDIPGPDPAAGLQRLLAGGRVRDGGELRVRGRDVRRLVVTSSTAADRRQRIVYDVDPDTFAPVQVQITNVAGLPATSGRPPSQVRTVFSVVVTRYETLPDDAAGARLLRIATPPGTTVRTSRVGTRPRPAPVAP